MTSFILFPLVTFREVTQLKLTHQSKTAGNDIINHVGIQLGLTGRSSACLDSSPPPLLSSILRSRSPTGLNQDVISGNASLCVARPRAGGRCCPKLYDKRKMPPLLASSILYRTLAGMHRRVRAPVHRPATIVAVNVFLISHKVTGVLGDRCCIIGHLCEHQSA